MRRRRNDFHYPADRHVLQTCLMSCPGGTIFGRKCVGSPSFLSSGNDQLRRSGCTNWEVEAMVNSAFLAPHKPSEKNRA